MWHVYVRNWRFKGMCFINKRSGFFLDLCERKKVKKKSSAHNIKVPLEIID